MERKDIEKYQNIQIANQKNTKRALFGLFERKTQKLDNPQAEKISNYIKESVGNKLDKELNELSERINQDIVLNFENKIYKDGVYIFDEKEYEEKLQNNYSQFFRENRNKDILNQERLEELEKIKIETDNEVGRNRYFSHKIPQRWNRMGPMDADIKAANWNHIQLNSDLIDYAITSFSHDILKDFYKYQKLNSKQIAVYFFNCVVLKDGSNSNFDDLLINQQKLGVGDDVINHALELIKKLKRTYKKNEIQGYDYSRIVFHELENVIPLSPDINNESFNAALRMYHEQLCENSNEVFNYENYDKITLENYIEIKNKIYSSIDIGEGLRYKFLALDNERFEKVLSWYRYFNKDIPIAFSIPAYFIMALSAKQELDLINDPKYLDMAITHPIKKVMWAAVNNHKLNVSQLSSLYAYENLTIDERNMIIQRQMSDFKLGIIDLKKATNVKERLIEDEETDNIIALLHKAKCILEH